jgi:acetate kinase
LAQPGRQWLLNEIMHSILVINSGSSSLRFALFKLGETLSPILLGKFDRIELPDAKLSFTDVRANKSDERTIHASNQVACVPLLVELLEKKTGASAIGRNWKWGGKEAK